MMTSDASKRKMKPKLTRSFVCLYTEAMSTFVTLAKGCAKDRLVVVVTKSKDAMADVAKESNVLTPSDLMGAIGSSIAMVSNFEKQTVATCSHDTKSACTACAVFRYVLYSCAYLCVCVCVCVCV